MLTICVFYGIIIMLYLKDKEYNPPHIHAIEVRFLKDLIVELAFQDENNS